MSDDRLTHWCSVCQQDTGGGSHYHCGRCMDPKPTSMMGHYLRFDDMTWGFYCDEANLGKVTGMGRVVDESTIRPAHSNETQTVDP